MGVQEILEKAEEGLTVERVFGRPYERNGLTVIPAARVAGGAGGGEGPDESGGGGFGGVSVPSGAFVIEGSSVTWRPAVDVNRIVLGMQLVLAVAILTAGSVARARSRRRVDVEPVLRTAVKLAALRRRRR